MANADAINRKKTSSFPIVNVLGLTLIISLFTWGISNEHSLYNFGMNALFNGVLTFCLWYGSWAISSGIRLSWVEYPVRHFLLTAFLTVGLVLITTSLARIITLWVCCDEPAWTAIRTTRLADFLIIFLVTGLVSTFVHGKAFLKQWKQAVQDAREMKQAYVEAEYELLKQQVNPHFLFNSLNVLHTLVYQDPDRAAAFIRKLSKVYRYVLEGHRAQLVTLEEELDVLHAYLEMLETRFGESLIWEERIYSDPKTKGLVPLSLQMLVENVVKHNALSENQPIQIRLEQSGEYLLMSNSIRPIDEKMPSTHLGLKNIADRYRYLVNREVEVSVTEEWFTVGLPLINLQT